MAKNNPAVVLNYYLQEAVPEVLPGLYGDATIQMRPSRPNDINDLWNNSTTLTNNTALAAVYERMFKLRRGAFPHCKCEQIIYYLYSVGGSGDDQIETLMETTQAIYDLLNRGDESAEEINKWQKGNLNENDSLDIYGTEFSPVYFHELKLFQLEETRDVIDFATAETYFGNKLIIDYEYHDNKSFNSGQPLFKDGSYNVI